MLLEHLEHINLQNAFVYVLQVYQHDSRAFTSSIDEPSFRKKVQGGERIAL